jgi:hypothetical protein
MKTYREVDVQIHVFLTSVLVGVERSSSRPGHFTPSTHWIGSWVDPRAGLDDVEKREVLTLPELEPRPLDRPARNQSLYRLCYLGSLVNEAYANSRCSQGRAMRSTDNTRTLYVPVCELHMSSNGNEIV